MYTFYPKLNQVLGSSEGDEGIQWWLIHSLKSWSLSQEYKGPSCRCLREKCNLNTSRRAHSPHVLMDGKGLVWNIDDKKESWKIILSNFYTLADNWYRVIHVCQAADQSLELFWVWPNCGHSGWQFAFCWPWAPTESVWAEGIQGKSFVLRKLSWLQQADGMGRKEWRQM